MMPINVSQAINHSTAETVTVERRAGGEYVDGIYQAGSIETFSTLASVQQPSPDEMQMIEEGERNKDIRKFISLKEIRSTKDRDGQEPDYVIYKGNKYKIIMSADWQSYGYYRSFGARVE